MFLAIAGDQIEQDLQPLLGRKASIEVAVGGLGLSVAIELADDKNHRLHELVHRNPLEHLDVLEDVFRHHRFLLGRILAAGRRNAQQADDGYFIIRAAARIVE
jgi:hypothetical protein